MTLIVSRPDGHIFCGRWHLSRTAILNVSCLCEQRRKDKPQTHEILRADCSKRSFVKKYQRSMLWSRSIVLYHFRTKQSFCCWRNGALKVDLFNEKISTLMDTRDLSTKRWLLLLLLLCTKLQKALSKNIIRKEWTTHKVYNNNNYYEPGKEWRKFKLVYGRKDKHWSGQGASSAHRTCMWISFPIGIRRSTSLPLTVDHPPPTSPPCPVPERMVVVKQSLQLKDTLFILKTYTIPAKQNNDDSFAFTTAAAKWYCPLLSILLLLQSCMESTFMGQVLEL